MALTSSKSLSNRSSRRFVSFSAYTSREFGQPLSSEWTLDQNNAPVVESLMAKLENIMPSTMNNLEKGECGKVCIVGGSCVHTGPPFWAGDLALKCGADIVIVVTTRSAAIPVKSYSSALTVVPYLPEKNDEISSTKTIDMLWPIVRDCHAFCIGPGLGDDSKTLKAVKMLIQRIESSEIPIVLNSGVNRKIGFLSCDPLKVQSVLILDEEEFVQIWDDVCELDILSFEANESGAPPLDENHCPLGVEFSIYEYPNDHSINQTADVARALGSNVTVVRIGFYDVVTDAGKCFVFGGAQLPRRCSFHGDLLAALTTVFLSWQMLKIGRSIPREAASAADIVLKLAILDSPRRRGIIASDVTKCIPQVIQNVEDIYSKRSL